MFLNIKCAFWFSLQLSSETLLILKIIEQDMVKKLYIGLHIKYPLFLSDLKENRFFWTDSWEILKYKI